MRNVEGEKEKGENTERGKGREGGEEGGARQWRRQSVHMVGDAGKWKEGSCGIGAWGYKERHAHLGRG